MSNRYVPGAVVTGMVTVLRSASCADGARSLGDENVCSASRTAHAGSVSPFGLVFQAGSAQPDGSRKYPCRRSDAVRTPLLSTAAAFTSEMDCPAGTLPGETLPKSGDVSVGLETIESSGAGLCERKQSEAPGTQFLSITLRIGGFFVGSNGTKPGDAGAPGLRYARSVTVYRSGAGGVSVTPTGVSVLSDDASDGAIVKAEFSTNA